MSIAQSSRARGSTRGGCGGGYEATSSTYDTDKLKRLRREYDEMDPQWRETFLAGLSRFERAVVQNRRIEIHE